VGDRGVDADLLQALQPHQLQVEVVVRRRCRRHAVVEGQRVRVPLALVRRAERSADVLAEPASEDLVAKRATVDDDR